MRILQSFFLLLLCVLPVAAQPESRDADAELKRLIALQQELLGRAALAASQEEVETLRPRLQTLIFDFERYLRNYPKKVEGYVAYSMILGNAMIDERERAEALLLKANELDPNLAVVKNQLGKYLAEAGRPLEALNYFLSAVQLEPEEPLYHFQIGQLLGAARADFLQSGEWTVGQIDAAMIHALEEAVRLDPDSLPYAYRLAEAHYDVAEPDWDQAMTSWLALEARSEDPITQQMMRLHQANVSLYQGQLDQAEAVLGGIDQAPLIEQRDALLARLDRLRHPEDHPAEKVATTPAPTPAPAPTTVKPLEVPAFQSGSIEDVGAITSATVVGIAMESPAELPTAPLGETEAEAPEATALEPAPETLAPAKP